MKERESEREKESGRDSERECECDKEKECNREFLIDNLQVRIHFIIEMIRWTGLAPWELEFPFSGSLTSTFPEKERDT